MVFDYVVQQCGARYVDVGDAVVAEDPDRHPQGVVTIRLTLPAVPRAQPQGQCQRVAGPGTIDGWEPRDLQQQSLAQAPFAVHRSNRVQRILASSRLSVASMVIGGPGARFTMPSAATIAPSRLGPIGSGSCHDPTACHFAHQLDRKSVV